ncbi:MAG: FG-GAP-like repeat-containing protein, partial [Verrucomicrobiota bacterium]
MTAGICLAVAALSPSAADSTRIMSTTLDGNYLAGGYLGGLTASKPVFVDIDNNGTPDLFVGEENGTLIFYRNIGTPTTPAWDLPETNYAGLAVSGRASPCFVDLNHDLLVDLLLGGSDGRVFYVKNIGTREDPVWAPPLDTGIDVGENAVVTAGDINGDDRVDLVLGNAAGELTLVMN